MRGDRGDHLVAVVALGDDLEPVVGAEDARHAGPHDRLVVDDAATRITTRTDRRSRLGSGGARQPGVAPASRRRVGPAVELAAERAGPLPHADEAEVARRRRSGRRRRPAVVGHAADRSRAPSSTSTRDVDAVARRVAGHVGQRLASDPVQRRARRALDVGRGRRDVRASMSSPARRYSSTSADEVGRRRPAADRCRARRSAARPRWPGSDRGSTDRPSRRRPAPAPPRRGRGAARGGAGDVQQHRRPACDRPGRAARGRCAAAPRPRPARRAPHGPPPSCSISIVLAAEAP